MKISLTKLFLGAMVVSIGWDLGKALPLVVQRLMSDEVKKDIKAAYNRGTAKNEADVQEGDWAKWAKTLRESPTNKTGDTE